MCYFPKFHYHIEDDGLLALQRRRAVQFLTTFKNLLLEHVLNRKCYGNVRPIFQSSFEDTTITINFLKSHICTDLVLKLIHCLLISTIKNWGMSESDHNS